ncbi:urea transporter [Hymenobacter sp. GOD-10R]|uniref:urea transporter n=1 Tax=Hymenobacter sp. GOD-10R TaxID=3093922 RepID=UPI002D76B387|nr:urea transporter [Hymenobacter sp. GOD-10R]WRQ29266.1 urea transporter [Hymenobacter sp. GOD-10R]
MNRIRTVVGPFGAAVLRSYSLLFFSQHRGFAVLLLLATFLNPSAGAAGLAAACLAVAGARVGGFSEELIQLGAYSFNALLVGLALGTFYQITGAFWVVLAVGALLGLLLAVALSGWLGKSGLPTLSLPFLLTIWVLVPAADQFHGLLLNEASIYWLNDVYALGGEQLVSLAQQVGEWSIPSSITTYLRALSAVLFQDSVPGGLLVAVGLLWHSRIAFSLSVLAYGGACGFGLLAGGPVVSLAYYDLGANYMMAALAVGGVFLIPSLKSYLVGLATIPLTAVLITGLGKLLAGVGLPLFSLPFCGTALLALYTLLLRTRPEELPLTPFQSYSPERNLYAYRSDQARLRHQLYYQLSLPFRGEWLVTQGYNSGLTHQGEWAHALDFMVADADGKTYHNTGVALTDYYCFNKPVLAPADGVVEALVMHIADNAPGATNTHQNWGNTLVLRHQTGLYTKLSHLRAHSAQVQVGEFVRKGTVLAYCGNSGRSAEPHLHFQVQATPYIGSRTLAYPLAYFLTQTAGGQQFDSFTVPQVGDTVCNPELNPLLRQALAFAPGYCLDVRSADDPTAPAQRWEALTNAYNQTYLRCRTTGATAYFERNDTVFYFTAYQGSQHAWLYQLYLAAYRVPLTYLPTETVHDAFPLSLVTSPGLQGVQDVLAPFWLFIKPEFTLQYGTPDNPYHTRALCLRSRVAVRVLGRTTFEQEAHLALRDGALQEITIHQGSHTQRLLCSTVSS